jgi:hypothetical protein
VKTIQCVCDGHCPHHQQNGTCETRGSCFTAVEEVWDEQSGEYVAEWSYGCLAQEQGGGLLQVINKILNIIPHPNPPLLFVLLHSAK